MLSTVAIDIIAILLNVNDMPASAKGQHLPEELEYMNTYPMHTIA